MSQITDKRTAEDKLGKEAIEEIVNKEWNTAELPTEEDLKKENSKSPKARSNINSRKNLIQYRKKKPKEVKEKIVKNLTYKNKRRDINPFDYIKIEDEELKNRLEAQLPYRKVLATAAEEEFFYKMINNFLIDFDTDELSVSDLDDIVNLALNRVLIDRMLEESADDPVGLLDVAASVERFKKESKLLKQNLANRRSDRIDTKVKQNYSIVDLVAAYDDAKKEEFEKRVKDWDEKKKSITMRDK